MRSRLILNALLLVGVGALAAFVFRADEPATDSPIERLTDADPRSVRRIEVQRAGREQFQLTRDDTGWRVAWSRELPANEFKVQTLTALLQAPVKAGFRAAGNDLAQFGLDPPLAVLHFDGLRLALGDTDPLDHRRYVSDGEEVKLVNDTVMHHLASGPGGFVHPNPLGPMPVLRALHLPSLTLERRDGRWQLQPGDAVKSADDITAYVDRWRRARAARVAPSRSQPTETLRAELEDGTEITLGILRTPIQIVLVREDLGLDYHFIKSAGERLLAP